MLLAGKERLKFYGQASVKGGVVLDFFIRIALLPVITGCKIGNNTFECQIVHDVPFYGEVILLAVIVIP